MNEMNERRFQEESLSLFLISTKHVRSNPQECRFFVVLHSALRQIQFYKGWLGLL